LSNYSKKRERTPQNSFYETRTTDFKVRLHKYIKNIINQIPDECRYKNSQQNTCKLNPKAYKKDDSS
jgi:hypothetical protein